MIRISTHKVSKRLGIVNDSCTATEARRPFLPIMSIVSCRHDPQKFHASSTSNRNVVMDDRRAERVVELVRD